ncbi:MAG: hypothetical protein OER95_15355 [Acidimicrobiia bacterium]|nr:hypothetical protein [Acidimicrobiia bacterium]
MSETLLTIHDLFQYAAMIAVLAAIWEGFRGGLGPRVFDAAGWVLRIQLVLGIIVWLVNSGWNLGAVQGVIHPIAGVAAVGAAEIYTARGNRVTDGSGSRTKGMGFAIALALVIAAIGLAEVA